MASRHDTEAGLTVRLVTIGLAVSLVPILLRVLPSLAKDAATNERDPDYAVTVVGLFFYVVVVSGVLVLPTSSSFLAIVGRVEARTTRDAAQDGGGGHVSPS